MDNDSIRLPAVSGAFYPSGKKDLEDAVHCFIEEAKKISPNNSLPKTRLKALIVPHAGYIYSGIVAASGFNLLTKQNLKSPKIILLGPSHNIYFQGFASSSSKYWETPLGNVKLENALINRIVSEHPEIFSISDEAQSGEHSLEVELPFLQETLKEFSIIPFLTGEGDPESYALAIKKFEKEIDFIIVSSDLSHYFQYNTAAKIDKSTIDSIKNFDFEKTENKGEACGKQGILTLMYLAKKNNWKPYLVAYKNSGDTAGDKDAVVGYCCFAFYE